MVATRGRLFSVFRNPRKALELELELIQTQMTQKPMLRAEVGIACVAQIK